MKLAGRIKSSEFDGRFKNLPLGWHVERANKIFIKIK